MSVTMLDIMFTKCYLDLPFLNELGVDVIYWPNHEVESHQIEIQNDGVGTGMSDVL